jgi:hypothetical protein
MIGAGQGFGLVDDVGAAIAFEPGVGTETEGSAALSVLALVVTLSTIGLAKRQQFADPGEVVLIGGIGPRASSWRAHWDWTGCVR